MCILNKISEIISYNIKECGEILFIISKFKMIDGINVNTNVDSNVNTNVNTNEYFMEYFSKYFSECTKENILSLKSLINSFQFNINIFITKFNNLSKINKIKIKNLINDYLNLLSNYKFKYKSLLKILNIFQLNILLNEFKDLKELSYKNPNSLMNWEIICKNKFKNKRILACKIILAAKCDNLNIYKDFSNKLIDEKNIKGKKNIKKSIGKNFINININNTTRGGHKIKRRRINKRNKTSLNSFIYSTSNSSVDTDDDL